MIPFRFEPDTHTYTELATGRRIPHITELLERGGWQEDARWFTEESRHRGTMVHQLTAAYDLGAIAREDVPALETEFKGYLLSHVAAVDAIQWRLEAVEEPRVHPRYRFGGRSDRVGELFGLKAVCEGKSGPPAKAHGIQTALQAILEAERWQLRPELVARFCLYWKANGRYKLEEHKSAKDFDEAYRIIRECCE